MHPNLLFVSGILSIPAFILITFLPFKLGLLVFYYFLAILNKKKVSLLYFLILSFFIISFETLIPAGKILFSIGPVKITALALNRGLRKAATLVGLVFISLSTIKKDLKIPGGAGIIFEKTFYYFEQFFQLRKKIRPKEFIKSLDLALFSVFPADGSGLPVPASEKPAAGYPILLSSSLCLLLTAIPWTVFIIEKIIR